MNTGTLQKRDDGFTLIELLVVILIIGILSAIAVPAFLSQRHKAWDVDAQTALRKAGQLVEAQRLNSGTVPDANGIFSTSPASATTQLQKDIRILTHRGDGTTAQDYALAFKATGATTFVMCSASKKYDEAQIFIYDSNTNRVSPKNTVTSGQTAADQNIPGSDCV